MSKDITAILTFRNKENRLKNLEFVLNWLEQTSLVQEIILVEQDREPIFHSYFRPKISKLKYLFFYNPNSFNKSIAFNLGSRFSSNEKLFFNDSDIIFDFLSVQNELFHWNFDAMSPYNEVIDLGKTESNSLIEGEKAFNIDNISTIREGICFAGGGFFITKNTYEKIGGFNEDFNSWGGEDDYFSIILEKNSCKLVTIKQKAYHLYHERDIYSTYMNPSYKSNILILESLNALKTEQLHVLNSIRSKSNANLEKFAKCGKGDYFDFKIAFGHKESSNDYTVVNSLNFMGKYQMGFERLQDLGIVKFNGRDYLWENRLDQNIFLNNRILQENVFDLHFADILDRLIKEYSMYINFNINDTKLTLSGMFAGVHLLGFESLDRRLQHSEVRCDDYGTSIDVYLELFSGYKILNYFK